MPARRSVVIGATSVIGTLLLDRLVASGDCPLALSRSVHPPQPGVDWMTIDQVIKPPQAALGTNLTLYSLSPLWQLSAYLPALFEAGVGRVVACSSTSLQTKKQSAVASERRTASKLQVAEDEVARLCEHANVAWTILRPTMIYVEGRDRNVTRIAGLVRRFKFFPIAGTGKGLRQPVHGDDLAAGFIAAAASSTARNQTYDLPGGETIAYKELVGRIFDALDLPRRIVPVPQVIWQLALKAAGERLPGVTAAMGDRMSKDLVFDADPARQAFGWQPRDFRPRFSQISPNG